MPSIRKSAAAVALPPNLVWRSYAGGRVLRQFRGMPESPDDHFPEDWLASTVCARNGANSQGAREGLSCLAHANGMRLDQALRAEPEYWFGSREPDRKDTGVLWKLLDSSVRLQFQAHPDAQFARANLNSNAGKTECWYIIGTRGEGCVYLGFQRPPARSAWAGMIREQRVDDMLGCFDALQVHPGDCLVVPAGTPHAIGAGVFLMELMEPTDWAVRCETVNAGVRLPPEACFMGIGLERCLDIFDYRAFSLAQVRERFQQQPRIVVQGGSWIEQEIIGAPWHRFFRLHRLSGKGAAEWDGGELMLLIVLRGSAELTANSEVRRVRSGETWLLPGAAERWHWRGAQEDWEVLIAKLPLGKKQ